MKKILLAVAVVAFAACSGPAFDPAAVADTTSGNVRAIWCDDGYLIAYDPSWIFTDLYSS